MSTCDEFREKNGREEGEGERNRDAINGLTSNPNNDRRIEFSFYKLSWRGEGERRDRDRFREKCQSESYRRGDRTISTRVICSCLIAIRL